ncbi:hypothetical protein AMATHDRAFT_49640 [Amanita thiersii Skay4041]|uniref:Epidermal growth factor receptor-like transmembrane-juxtamembrane segment domain-containing protein n=1 Tax=Amanita thiersii Skay4041 TaxID=703135 RepID=A0A2A9NJ05_9AGAR|nr:hypothetical protein AMATHDRAFT_49640 [Amanita thiersii Skay4041]
MAVTAAAMLAGVSAQNSSTSGSDHAACAPSFEWMNNAQGTSPCTVAEQIGAACAAGSWLIPPLGGHQYAAPNTTTRNYCICRAVGADNRLFSPCPSSSWSFYNLLEGCTACQNSARILGLFPVEHATPMAGTMIPFWSTRDPATWLSGSFNLDQAKQMDDQGKPDVDPSKVTKKKSPAGAIAGGVVGGVVGATIIGVVLFIWLRRRHRVKSRREAILDPMPDFSTEPTAIHARSMSDLSGKMNPLSYTSIPQSTTPFGGFTTSSSPANGTAATLHTHFGTSNHSLPYDVSLIGSAAFQHQSPAPSAPQTLSPTSPGQSVARLDSPEAVIVPFTLGAAHTDNGTHQPQHSTDRKGGYLYDQLTGRSGGHSPGNSLDSGNGNGVMGLGLNTGRRGRMNPPAYSERPREEAGESTVTHSPTQSIDSKRRLGHGRLGSGDTQGTSGNGNGGSGSGWETASLRTHVPAGSVSGLDDVVSQMGIGNGGSSAAGAGAGAGTSLGVAHSVVGRVGHTTGTGSGSEQSGQQLQQPVRSTGPMSGASVITGPDIA